MSQKCMVCGNSSDTSNKFLVFNTNQFGMNPKLLGAAEIKLCYACCAKNTKLSIENYVWMAAAPILAVAGVLAIAAGQFTSAPLIQKLLILLAMAAGFIGTPLQIMHLMKLRSKNQETLKKHVLAHLEKGEIEQIATKALKGLNSIEPEYVLFNFDELSAADASDPKYKAKTKRPIKPNSDQMLVLKPLISPENLTYKTLYTFAPSNLSESDTQTLEKIKQAVL